MNTGLLKNLDDTVRQALELLAEHTVVGHTFKRVSSTSVRYF